MHGLQKLCFEHVTDDFSLHHRAMMHVGSLEATPASRLLSKLPK